jgi:hypothetical protein
MSSPHVKQVMALYAPDLPLEAALRAWRFTGVVRDFGDSVERCQLCAHTGLRFHYQIASGDQQLWVGSECILKFDIAVHVDGKALLGAAREAHLEARRKAARLERCLQLLEAAAAKTDNEILAHAVSFYRRNQALSPKLAFVVVWQLPKLGTDLVASDFAVTTKTQKFRNDLREMPSSRVRMIWPALTAAQRKTAKRWHDLD